MDGHDGNDIMGTTRWENMVDGHDARTGWERQDGNTCFGIPQRHDGNDVMERHERRLDGEP